VREWCQVHRLRIGRAAGNLTRACVRSRENTSCTRAHALLGSQRPYRRLRGKGQLLSAQRQPQVHRIADRHLELRRLRGQVCRSFLLRGYVARLSMKHYTYLDRASLA
jgi:hypothetical protein